MSATTTTPSLRDAIENLFYRYARCYDEEDFTAFGECFAEDAELFNKEWIRGRQAIVDALTASRRERGAQGQRPRHITTNIAIEPTGPKEASVHSLFSLAVTTRQGTVIDFTGTYTDTIRCGDGTWQLARRVIARDSWD